MELCGPWVSTCKRLLSVLLSAEPRIRRLVADRLRALTKAIEGLGQHGLVGTSDQVCERTTVVSLLLDGVYAHHTLYLYHLTVFSRLAIWGEKKKFFCPYVSS